MALWPADGGAAGLLRNRARLPGELPIVGSGGARRSIATMSVESVLKEFPVWDGHNDLAWEARVQADYDWARLGFATGTGEATHTDLPRLRTGGVGAQFWSVWVPSTPAGAHAVVMTLEQIDAIRRLVAGHPADLQLAVSAAEVETAWRHGRIACLLGAEGGHSIADSLGVLRCLYDLGVRYLTLTHNDNTSWADSATDVPRHHGLSDFGRRVVAEMNRLGMLVDLSHVSADTMRDALEVSSAPVMFSHSSARAVCDVPRNVPDDVLSRLASNGGICMVTFVPQFVSQAYAAWSDAGAAAAAKVGIPRTDVAAFRGFLDRWQLDHPAPPTSIEDVVAHLEHVREVAGIDHLGLGGDYDGATGFAAGISDVSGYPALLDRLVERGWSDSDLRRLTSANMLRVMREAEDIASAG